MLNTTECPNLRDLGGIHTKNGMVKPMRLIRSGALWRISNTAALGQLSAVFDMRSENERSFHPDPAFPGADYIHIQVSESGRRKFTQSKRTFEDKVDDILAGYYRGEQSASERMREVYRSIVFSENTAVCICGIIRAANAERGAVLFHCATGKDRLAQMMQQYMPTTCAQTKRLSMSLLRPTRLPWQKAGMTKLPPAMYSASSLPAHAGSRLRSIRSTAASAHRPNMLRMLQA